jgi:hypothetical protein
VEASGETELPLRYLMTNHCDWLHSRSQWQAPRAWSGIHWTSTVTKEPCSLPGGLLVQYEGMTVGFPDVDRRDVWKEPVGHRGKQDAARRKRRLGLAVIPTRFGDA